MRNLRLFIVLVVAGSCLTRAYAATETWRCYADASCNHQDTISYAEVGVTPSADDDYDALDYLLTPGSRVYVGIYHVADEHGWNGPTGFYSDDLRSPLPLTEGASHTWRLYVWADDTLYTDSKDILFRAGLGSPGRVPQIDVWLTYVSRPLSISGGPDIGTSWHVSQLDGMGVTLPVFRTSNGLDGYVFDLTATVVPEPSCLAALATGLAGIAGAAIRRRRP